MTATATARHVARYHKAQAEIVAARQKRNDAIRAMAAAGMSYRAIAQAVGVTHQRIAQIIKESS
jgi:transposase-like protein